MIRLLMDRMRMIRFAPSLLIHPFLLLLSRSLFPDQGHLCPPSSFRLVFTLTFPFPPASSRPLLANASLLPVLLKTLSSSSSCCHRDGPRLPLFSRRVLPLSVPDLGAVTALGARAWWYGGAGSHCVTSCSRSPASECIAVPSPDCRLPLRSVAGERGPGKPPCGWAQVRTGAGRLAGAVAPYPVAGQPRGHQQPRIPRVTGVSSHGAAARGPRCTLNAVFPPGMWVP